MDWIRMLLVARPYLEGFVEGWCEVSTPFPFVLLVVNGGDAPLTEELQSQILLLDGLRGCFANNLHNTRYPHIFHPLPLGLTSENVLDDVRMKAAPWHERDRRLLLTPMRMQSGQVAQPRQEALPGSLVGPRVWRCGEGHYRASGL